MTTLKALFIVSFGLAFSFGFPGHKLQAAQAECRVISRADAISQAKRRVKGKVVGVQLSKRGSRSIYRVRMLVDQKRVKTLSIPACR